VGEALRVAMDSGREFAADVFWELCSFVYFKAFSQKMQS
jgi:hypothetical protein